MTVREQEFDVFPPKWKLAATFINRIGFPILAFLIMAYVCLVSLREVHQALEATNVTLSKILQFMQDAK